MVAAIIAAAGQGRRMGRGMNKAFIKLQGKPVLAHTVKAIAACNEVKELVLVAAVAEVEQIEALLRELENDFLQIPWQVVAGGTKRQYSVANGLQAVSSDADIVLVHDGARPLVALEAVSEVIRAARENQAAVVAVPVKDTIKKVDTDGFVRETPLRSELWSIQTPQAFAISLLRQAYTQAEQDGFVGTDEASLVERLGVKVKIVSGNYQNIKLTTPEDIVFAESLLASKQEKAVAAKSSLLRCGQGYDVHRLVAGRKLILGGVEIPYGQGLDGHSDADVLLHAIKDALLGAAALGDIGRHFPDSDIRYQGISSLLLLKKVRELLTAAGYMVNNVDATVVAQKPKLAAYIQQMNANIAAALQVQTGQINVKATTTEGLGFAGRQEGIGAYAVVTIMSL